MDVDASAVNRLQEKVLEVLGERAFTPKMLYVKLAGDSPPAVDAALSGLLRSAAVSFELGYYQRIVNGRRPAAVVQAPTSIASVAKPAPTGMPLTEREAEISRLRDSGLSHAQIAERLGISIHVVSQHLSNARHKLGIKAKVGRPAKPRLATSEGQKVSQTEVTAAPPPARGKPSGVALDLRGDGAAAPSASHGTGEPGQQSSASSRPREPARQPGETGIPFSPGLIRRLIEQQRALVMSVQVLRDRLDMKQQELADVEELVRIATRKEGTG